LEQPTTVPHRKIAARRLTRPAADAFPAEVFVLSEDPKCTPDEKSCEIGAPFYDFLRV
jgi:hypothetical protein